MNKLLLDKIAAQKENPLPTPPVGFTVQWFDRNDDGMCYAATVTAIQGPGKLELAVQKPRHMIQHKQGVLYRGHPCHEEKANQATIRNGAWDYIPVMKIPRSHIELHLEELERREQSVFEEQRVSQEIEKRREELAKSYREEVASAVADTPKQPVSAGKK